MAQQNLPPVPKISNPEEYLQEVFGTSKDGIPSFFEFMDKLRGMPVSKFSKESLETLALIMETTFYSQYANMVAEINKSSSKTNDEGAQIDNWAQGVSMEEIEGAESAMLMRLEQLRAVKEKKMATV